MPRYVKQSITLVIAADGTATGYTDVVNGTITAVHYAHTDFFATATLDVTSEDTGVVLLAVPSFSFPTADTTFVPAMAGHRAADGVVMLAKDSQLQPFVVEERVKVAISLAQEAQVGTFTVIVDGTIREA